MQRAAVSIPSNIAEGSGRGSKKEFAQFVLIAQGSACELETQVEIAYAVGYLTEAQHRETARDIVEVKMMLTALRRSLMR